MDEHRPSEFVHGNDSEVPMDELLMSVDESKDGLEKAWESSPINQKDEGMDVDVKQKPESCSTLLEIKVDTTGNANTNSTDPRQCYCLKERNPNMVELQCGGCLRWFHESCISYQIGKCIPFMTNYHFVCKNCYSTGLESFTKKQANFVQMCQTAIANLMQQSIKEGNPRTMFSKDKEIVPYIDNNWENLTTVSRRIKQTWHTTIQKTMVKETDIFICEEKPPDSEPTPDHPLFALAVQDLLRIGPNYENYTKPGLYRSFDNQRICSSVSGGQTVGGIITGKGRSAKRKAPEQSIASTKKARSDLATPRLPPHGYPLEHPFNKDGYRYILAEPDPHAPFRQEFDESLDWAGKPIPGWLYRTQMPPTILMALHDRAPQLRIADDRLSVTGDKGYCMARATHGINRGVWYFECTIEDMPDNSAVRIGWSQALGNLQAPLGYDRFSYSWRSRKGTQFHESRGKHYSVGYGENDTLGVQLVLPSHADSSVNLPPTYKDKPLVKFKNHLYYEEKDEVQDAIKYLKPLQGSKIIFFKNGLSQGVAWENIYEGTYYPAISIYKNATVSVNFGPNFKYYPSGTTFRGISDAAQEAIIEQCLADMLYLTENEGKLRLDYL